MLVFEHANTSHTEMVRKLGARVFEAEDWAAELAYSQAANYHTYLLFNNSDLIGFVIYETDSAYAWISTLVIAPEFQRKGYGRQLLTKTLEQLQGQRVGLAVLEKNTRALVLYLRAGFQIKGRLDTDNREPCLELTWTAT